MVQGNAAPHNENGTRAQRSLMIPVCLNTAATFHLLTFEHGHAAFCYFLLLSARANTSNFNKSYLAPLKKYASLMSNDNWPFIPTEDFHGFQPGSAVIEPASEASSIWIFLTSSAMSDAKCSMTVVCSLETCFMHGWISWVSGFLQISKTWTVLTVDGDGLSVGFRHLDGVVFDCGCNIRWIQLWMQRGEAGLHTQELYCKNGASKIRLHNMYIQKCGKSMKTGRGRVCMCVCVWTALKEDRRNKSAEGRWETLKVGEQMSKGWWK